MRDAPLPSPIDCAVIGGGPAGLSGALYLARFCREVVVIDDGNSRAARIARSHNVAGFQSGIPGDRLLRTMRQQCVAVGVRFVHGHVDSLITESGGFRLRFDQHDVTARSVLLATGANDVEPQMQGLDNAVREGAVRYCPVCDGYEIREHTVGVLCDSTAGLSEALYLRHFTSQLHVFATSSAVAFTADDRQRMESAGMVLHASAVRDLQLERTGVRVRDGEGEVYCDSLYAALGMRVHSELAVACGAAVDDEGYLLIDRHQETTVAGLYAAGDVARGLNQISVAIGAAAVAASAMHLRQMAATSAAVVSHASP